MKKNLPLELVMEILSWLPIKPLFRFMCVSKTWLQFLTLDPQFAKLHCDRSIQPNKLNPNHLGILALPSDKKDLLWLTLDYTSSDKEIYLNLPFLEGGGENRFYDIFGVCNGLAMIRLYRGNDQEIYIWNPLTKDYITIPSPPIPSTGGFSYDVYGFGYDQGRNEYKLVRIFCEVDSKPQSFFCSQVSVYTLGVDFSWRTVDEENQYVLDNDFINSSLVNGALHWISKRDGTSSWDLIVAFDIRHEVFREIKPPIDMSLDEVNFDQYVVEIGGSLCTFTGLTGRVIELWMMKEYGVFNSWTKLLKVDKMEAGFDGFGAYGFIHNGDTILMSKNQTLYLCKPKTKARRSLKQFGSDDFILCTYVGSIISPRVISRVEILVEEEET